MRLKTEAAPETVYPIRACVMSPDHRRYWTWYWHGNVTVTVDGVAEQAGRAWNIEGFNALLERNGVVGLRGSGAWKCPERLKP
jgi:hypothetical protein